jgi:hypothetical protein
VILGAAADERQKNGERRKSAEHGDVKG